MDDFFKEFNGIFLIVDSEVIGITIEEVDDGSEDFGAKGMECFNPW